MTRGALRLAPALAMTAMLAGCEMLAAEDDRLSGERIRIRDRAAPAEATPTRAAAPLSEPILNRD